MSSVPEPVHGQLDSPAREDYSHGYNEKTKAGSVEKQAGFSRVVFPGNSLDPSLIISGNQANLHFENRSFFTQNISLNRNQLLVITCRGSQAPWGVHSF